MNELSSSEDVKKLAEENRERNFKKSEDRFGLQPKGRKAQVRRHQVFNPTRKRVTNP